MLKKYCVDVLYKIFKFIHLPSVVNTSTSQSDSDPSTPTSCKKTYWPTRTRAQVNVFVIPSSGIKVRTK